MQNFKQTFQNTTELNQYLASMNKPKSKFGSKKVIYDGYKFDSKLECEFYIYLKKHSNIVLEELQPKVVLCEKVEEKVKVGNRTKTRVKHRAIKYIPDFRISYNDQTYFVDAKGIQTPVFKLKMNLYQRACSTPLIIAHNLRQLEADLRITQSG